MAKLTIEDLVGMFTSPRGDHPGRRGATVKRSRIGNESKTKRPSVDRFGVPVIRIRIRSAGRR